jgi:hypothetical protein
MINMFFRKLCHTIWQVFSPCACGATLEDRQQLEERDKLINEWCTYLPLEDVLRLRYADVTEPNAVRTAEGYRLPAFGDVNIPRHLRERSVQHSIIGPISWWQPLFFGPLDVETTRKRLGYNLISLSGYDASFHATSDQTS